MKRLHLVGWLQQALRSNAAPRLKPSMARLAVPFGLCPSPSHIHVMLLRFIDQDFYSWRSPQLVWYYMKRSSNLRCDHSVSYSFCNICFIHFWNSFQFDPQTRPPHGVFHHITNLTSLSSYFECV